VRDIFLHPWVMKFEKELKKSKLDEDKQSPIKQSSFYNKSLSTVESIVNMNKKESTGTIRKLFLRRPN
jgi:lipopolysaccharide export LptBFGC system permease protein LptF